MHLARREGVGVETPGMEALQSVVDGKVTPETYSREYLEGVVNRLFVSLRNQKGMEQLFQDLAEVRQPSTIPPARVQNGERVPRRLGQALYDRTANDRAETLGLIFQAERHETTMFQVSATVRQRLLRLNAVFKAIMEQSKTSDMEIDRDAIEVFLSRAEQDLKMISELKDVTTIEDFVHLHDEIMMKTALAQMEHADIRAETSKLSVALHLLMLEDENRRVTIRNPQQARSYLIELHLRVNDALCPYSRAGTAALAAVIIPTPGVTTAPIQPVIMSSLPFFTKVAL